MRIVLNFRKKESVQNDEMVEPSVKTLGPWGLRAALWLGLGGLLRLRAAPPTVSDVDGVNFARALGGFDPLHQAPHLPGYGPYVGASAALEGLGLPELWALTLPGVIAWLAGALLLSTAARRLFGARLSELGLVALAALPGAALLGARPTSDGFGFGLWLLTLGAVGHARASTEDPRRKRRWLIAAAAAAGLMLGARLSWWPLVVGPAAVLSFSRLRVARNAAYAALAFGALAVLGPLLMVADPGPLLEGVATFATGHFSDWGGAIAPGDSLGARVERVLWGLWTALLGFWSPSEGLTTVPLSCLALAGGALALRARSAGQRLLGPEVRWLAIALGAYLLWLLLGQNVEKPRHLLPLVPAVALLLAMTFDALPGPPMTRTFALAGSLAVVAVPRAYEQARLAPGPRLVQFVARTEPPQGLQILAGEEARLFEHLAPAYRVLRPATGEVTRTEALRAHRSGVRVLITSGAPGIDGLKPFLQELRRASTSKSVRAHDHDLRLYRFEPMPNPTPRAAHALDMSNPSDEVRSAD